MRSVFIFCLLLVGCVLGIGTAGEAREGRLALLNGEEREALARLMEPRDYADSLVGYAGAVPEQAVDFQTLLASPAADEAFKELLAKGSRVGKLYGLCGIYFTDNARFAEAARELARQGGEVATFRGCIVSTEPVERLINGPGGIADGSAPEGLRTLGRFPAKWEFQWQREAAGGKAFQKVDD